MFKRHLILPLVLSALTAASARPFPPVLPAESVGSAIERLHPDGGEVSTHVLLPPFLSRGDTASTTSPHAGLSSLQLGATGTSTHRPLGGSGEGQLHPTVARQRKHDPESYLRVKANAAHRAAAWSSGELSVQEARRLGITQKRLFVQQALFRAHNPSLGQQGIGLPSPNRRGNQFHIEDSGLPPEVLVNLPKLEHRISAGGRKLATNPSQHRRLNAVLDYIEECRRKPGGPPCPTHPPGGPAGFHPPPAAAGNHPPPPTGVHPPPPTEVHPQPPAGVHPSTPPGAGVQQHRQEPLPDWPSTSNQPPFFHKFL